MVLDPFSALSLAGNIVQFFDFTLKVISVGSEVYESADGASSRNIELDEIFSSLKRISIALGTSSAAATLTTQQTEEEIDLYRLANSCQSICSEILAAVEKLRLKPGPHRRWHSLRQALKMVWKQREIDALEERLDNLRKQLTFSLTFILSDQQSTIIQELRALKNEDERLQLNQTKQLEQWLFDIRPGFYERIPAEDLDELARKISNVVRRASTITVSQRFLETLYFQTIKVRHSRINNAHKSTFKWIFKDAVNNQSGSRGTIRFADWLQSDSGRFYWISGKAGSGKSTLMKYLSDHSKTKEALKKWADPARLVVASYFFWSAGTSMQKSQKGLVQSLLYAIFNHCPELIAVVCLSRWKSAEQEQTAPPWHLEELTQTIHNIINQTTISAKFCFFIDGLDEYRGDHFDIIRSLDLLMQSPNIKICLSSRPWNVFQEAYGKSVDRKLYLQELTRKDIERYVRSKFEEHPAWESLIVNDTRYNDIVVEVNHKAQGVFLWVFLVVQSLLAGLTNGDTLSLLQERLRLIPADLKQYFKFMLDSLDPIYNSRVAHTFQAALNALEPLTLMTHSFLDDEFEDKDYAIDAEMEDMSAYDIILRHKDAQWRLNGRCKGLLEVRRDEMGVDFFRYRVEFLHRTVRDFFLTEDIQQGFANALPQSFNTHTSLLKASLVLVKKKPKLGEDLKKSQSFQSLLDDVIYYARQIEIETGDSPTRLLDELNHVLWNLALLGQPSNSRAVGRAWQAPGIEKFLELLIARGLCLYPSQKLKLLPSALYPKISMHLTERRRPVLDCALELPSPLTYGEPDVTEVVRFLLGNGADPNKTWEASTVFGHFLLRISTDSGNANVASEPTLISQRNRLLEYLLSHGADANACHKQIPIWGNFVLAFCWQEFTRQSSQSCLDTLELLLSSGADPNIRCSEFCHCHTSCSVWGSLLRFLSGPVPLPGGYKPHRLEFFSHMVAKFLEHGADQKIQINERSVEDIIKKVFPAKLLLPPLALLTKPKPEPRPEIEGVVPSLQVTSTLTAIMVSHQPQTNTEGCKTASEDVYPVPSWGLSKWFSWFN